ncbi:MAG: hypothetical protein QME51_10275 [Planctomycetota bacterium]|nr:hypothetical protein [Planctomycetota bacterium]
MFFPECGRLANKRPELRSIIEKVDEWLATRSHSSLFRPDEIASYLGEKESQISGVFAGLLKEGLFIEEKYLECPRCYKPIDVKEYKEAIDNDEPFECVWCQNDLAGQNVTKTTAYGLTPARIPDIHPDRTRKTPSAQYAHKDRNPTKEITTIRMYSKGKKWDNIEITFTKQNKILVYIDGGNPFPRSISYKQLNLHDRKNPDKPIEEWNILWELAEDNTGALSLDRLKDRNLLERYVSNLRKTFKDIFQIKDNPIPPKTRGQPYQFKFKLFTQKKVLEDKDDIKHLRPAE